WSASRGGWWTGPMGAASGCMKEHDGHHPDGRPPHPALRADPRVLARGQALFPGGRGKMSAPIYRDPIQDGAADPVVVRKEGTDEYWMFYTNRRAQMDAPGFGWIHGSPIGVAVSKDGGGSWTYRGTVKGLDAPGDDGLNTHWAPEVLWAEGQYHMFLS